MPLIRRTPARAKRSVARVWGQPLRYPNAYAWLVLVSALDAMCTWLVLSLGGVEVNPIADAVLYAHGFAGMVVFKFLLITLVIVLCEEIGRHRPRAGLRVALLGIALTTVPVIAALSQIAAVAWTSPG